MKKVTVTETRTLTIEEVKQPIKKLQFDVDPAFHHAFKLECVKRDVNMIDVVIPLLTEWMNRNE